MPETPQPREVGIARSGYQPSKKDLEEDMPVDATFEEAVDALTRPVRVRYVDRPRRQAAE